MGGANRPSETTLFALFRLTPFNFSPLTFYLTSSACCGPGNDPTLASGKSEFFANKNLLASFLTEVVYLVNTAKYLINAYF